MITVSTYPEFEIVTGMFSSMGMTYPPVPGSTSAGTIAVSVGDAEEESEVKVVGFGRVATDILDISWRAIPMVYISPLSQAFNYEGAHQALSDVAYRVHYIADNRDDKLLDSPLASGNPEQVVIIRTSGLRALLDEVWRDFGTSYRVNAQVQSVTLDNGFEAHFQRQNVFRICASFDVRTRYGWNLPCS